MKIGRFEFKIAKKEKKANIHDLSNNLIRLCQLVREHNTQNETAFTLYANKIKKLEQSVEIMTKILQKLQNGNN